MTGRRFASELAHRLAREAEAVCRQYLSSGYRAGNYWMVGDARNTSGRSMHVRLKDTPKGPAGKWVDEATAEYGDLLDVIRESCGLVEFRDVADEARRFLSLPPPEPESNTASAARERPRRGGSPGAARRLFAMAQPLAGTLGERYLRQRGIVFAARERWLRFHPGCYYRDLATGRTLTFPALIAAVTSLEGVLTGVQRTWLDPAGDGKALIADPRRSMGNLLGNGIRLGFDTGVPIEVMTAGEGLETMASLRTVMPAMPMVAATSANHLAALALPAGCARLYIAADADAAGRHGIDRLSRRCSEAGIVPLVLRPQLGDFNEDLRRVGPARLAAWLRDQLVPEDGRLHLTPG
jgi:hypothetical protein